MASPVDWIERALRTEAPPLGHVPELDGLRGWLVFSVLWTHYGHMEFAGALALDMFFALSGFLITALLLQERDRNGRISLRRFYERRGVRLLPELVICLGFQVVLALIGVFPTRTTLIEAFGAFFYVYPLTGGFIENGHELRMFHFWSLSFEEWYYFSWAPLMALFMAKARRRVAVAWTAIGVMAVVLLVLRGLAWRTNPDDLILELRVEQLAFGGFVALARRSFLARRAEGNPSPVERFLPAMMPLFFVFHVATWLTWAVYLGNDSTGTNWQWVTRPVGMVLCVGAVLASALDLNPRWLRRMVNWRPLVVLGAASYGIYIWHMVPFVLFNGEETYVADGLRYPVWVQIVVLTPITMVIGYCSTRYVAEPARRWYQRQRTPAPAPAAS